MDRNQISDWIRTLPNKLTIGRMCVIPILILLYPLDIQFLRFFCAFLFFLAALTDFFDGYLARKYNIETKIGALLDPIADKILVTASIVLLTNGGDMPAWMAALLLCREVAISGLRLAASEQKRNGEVNQLGKVKTFTQDSAICFLMIGTESFHTFGMICAWLALIFSYYSAYQYWNVFWEDSNSALTEK